jgi:N utilization substance protein A
VEGKVVLIDFGNVTAVMPLEEGIRTERYLPGSRFKFYVKNVEEGMRGPKVIVSRIHSDILRKLFKLEVPEIAAGTVIIKNIAREAGSRAKIAVMTKDNNVDPIGSCVGQRGSRVQTIIGEVGGEKIDIIEWVEEPAKFIAKALAPAKIIRVELLGQEEKKSKSGKMVTAKTEEATAEDNEDKIENQTGQKEAKVYVAEDQLSLAIGKDGQNVRLAAKLTGWKIDLLAEKLEEEKIEVASKEQMDSQVEK